MQYIFVFIISIFFYFFIRKNQNIRTLNTLFVIMFTLALTNFFGGFDKTNNAVIVFILPFVIFQYQQPYIFKKYIILLISFLFINMISCFYYRGQTIIESILLYNTYFSILYYFLLKQINISLPKMERVMLTLIILFLICYIIQYIVYPFVIFSGAREEFLDDIRIRLTGQGLVSLGYFFCINKILISRKFFKIYTILALLCLIVIFLMGFRTMLAGIILFTIVFYLKIYSFNLRFFLTTLLTCVLLILLLNIPVVEKKIDNMIERQKTANFQNEDYIRIIQLNYFTTQHFTNNWEYFFGSGEPLLPDKENNKKGSNYGNYMESLRLSGLTWVDFGLLSMSWILGIPAIITIIFYSIKAFRVKVSPEYYYIGIWFLYLLAISFTTLEILRAGNIAIEAFALVLVEKASYIKNLNT